MGQRAKRGVIVGEVVKYIRDKGLGFAEAPLGLNGELASVVLYDDGRRAVVGTADEPLITGVVDHNRHLPVDLKDPTKVVMMVIKSRKGFKAVAWGILPSRDWRIDLQKSGLLCQYVGGHVAVRFIGRGEGRIVQGKLEAFDLSTELLRLTLANCSENNGSNSIQPGPREFKFDLKSSSGGPRRVQYGRYLLELLDDEEVRITFYPLRDE